MKRLYNILFVVGVAMSLLTSCSDADSELTSVEYSRYFSPTTVEARVVDNVNVRLTWNAVPGADSYEVSIIKNSIQGAEETNNNDIVEVEGTEVKNITGITMEDLPLVIAGLEGKTTYTALVRAIGASNENSKWSGREFKTGTEQCFSNVSDADITANSVKLTWAETTPEFQTITVTPGDIVYTLTDADKASHSATIEGLVGETEYTFIALRNGEQCGKITATTAIDLGNAIAVHPEDNLNEAIANAETGATLALFPGTYKVAGETEGLAKILVEKSIAIKAAKASDRPVINGCIHITSGASLTMSQVILDGTDTDGSQAFEWRDAVSYGDFVLEDCEVRNYVKGFYYFNVAGTVSSVKINNCIIHDIQCSGGDMFDSRTGTINSISLTNSTVYDSATGRDLFRDNNSSNPVTINCNNNTFYNVGSAGVAYRIFYVRSTGNSITFQNNLVANFANTRGFTEQSKTNAPVFGNNAYYNCINLMSLADGNTQAIKYFDTDGREVKNNPFKDADKGDFTLTDEDLIYYKNGDPRWY
ncbi:MAG: DUF4957 domain-containing protein [Prevotella sp.]